LLTFSILTTHVKTEGEEGGDEKGKKGKKHRERGELFFALQRRKATFLYS